MFLYSNLTHFLPCACVYALHTRETLHFYQLIIIQEITPTFSFHKNLHQKLPGASESTDLLSKTLQKVKVRYCHIFGIPCNVNILAPCCLTVTFWNHMIGNMCVKQPGTGAGLKGRSAVCLVSRQKFIAFKERNPFVQLRVTC